MPAACLCKEAMVSEEAKLANESKRPKKAWGFIHGSSLEPAITMRCNVASFLVTVQESVSQGAATTAGHHSIMHPELTSATIIPFIQCLENPFHLLRHSPFPPLHTFTQTFSFCCSM